MVEKSQVTRSAKIAGTAILVGTSAFAAAVGDMINNAFAQGTADDLNNNVADTADFLKKITDQGITSVNIDKIDNPQHKQLLEMMDKDVKNQLGDNFTSEKYENAMSEKAELFDSYLQTAAQEFANSTSIIKDQGADKKLQVNIEKAYQGFQQFEKAISEHIVQKAEASGHLIDIPDEKVQAVADAIHDLSNEEFAIFREIRSAVNDNGRVLNLKPDVSSIDELHTLKNEYLKKTAEYTLFDRDGPRPNTHSEDPNVRISIENHDHKKDGKEYYRVKTTTYSSEPSIDYAKFPGQPQNAVSNLELYLGDKASLHLRGPIDVDDLAHFHSVVRSDGIQVAAADLTIKGFMEKGANFESATIQAKRLLDDSSLGFPVAEEVGKFYAEQSGKTVDKPSDKGDDSLGIKIAAGIGAAMAGLLVALKLRKKQEGPTKSA